MKTKFLALVMVLVGGIVSCSQKEKAVNQNSGYYPPVMVTDNQVTQDSLARAPLAAIEGRVMVDAQIPTPLSNVQLTVFKEVDTKLTKITQLSTDSAGKFRVTQKLTGGRYVIQITDARYKGRLDVVLNSPALDLVVLAQKKK